MFKSSMADALQVGAMQQHNHRLLGHYKRLERQKDVVMAQVRAMQDKWQEAEATRAHLQNEVDTLRKTLEARPCSSTPCTDWNPACVISLLAGT